MIPEVCWFQSRLFVAEDFGITDASANSTNRFHSQSRLAASDSDMAASQRVSNRFKGIVKLLEFTVL